MPPQYELLGIALENYINGYVPRGWKESIKTCFNATPFINPAKAQELTQKFQSGSLEKDLLEETDPLIKEFHVIREAIALFFKEGKYRKFIE